MSVPVISIASPRPVQHIALSINSDARKQALCLLGNHLREVGYRFTTPTPTTHARVNARRENACAVDLSGIFGWTRPFRPEVPGPVLLDLMYNAAVIDTHGEELKSAIRASTLDRDLYLHSAFPTADADSVFFGPDTYRFLRALKASLRERDGKAARVVDIGCGTGAAAVALGRAYPEATVYAVDINDAALALTAVNARLAQVDNVVPLNSNLLLSIEGEFDLIVANPPYLLDGDQRAYRHGGGNFGEGLSVEIVNAAIERLAPGGTLMLYTGAAIVNGADIFKDAVESRLRAGSFHWTYEEVDPDVFGEELDLPAYSRADRIAAIWLVATRN